MAKLLSRAANAVAKALDVSVYYEHRELIVLHCIISPRAFLTCNCESISNYLDGRRRPLGAKIQIVSHSEGVC